MNMFTSTWVRIFLCSIVCLGHEAFAQQDTLIRRVKPDTSLVKLNMDAVYNRPFLTAGKFPLAIGGYLEANTQFSGTDGVSEPFSFQMRRMSLFFSSTIAKRIKFLSELEFEEGTTEINLEYCAMDLEFHPLFNLRGGIIMNPIGAFNQNHDGPRWDFIDRPLSATGIIPSTLSNAGMGLHGKYFIRRWVIGYEIYATNGFDQFVIDNEEGRTSLHAGRQNPERFFENPSSEPMLTGKLAIRNRNIGEIGISYLNGVYGNAKPDGMVIGLRGGVQVIAFDFNTSLFKNKLNITGEYAHALIDVPASFTQQYGTEQYGMYTDFVYTLLNRKMLGWDNARLNLGVRGEMLDYNVGTFDFVGTNIGDDIWTVVPSLAFRPSGSTVIRFNFRRETATDLLDNAPTKTNVYQFGFSSYF